MSSPSDGSLCGGEDWTAVPAAVTKAQQSANPG
jgi:hypothetical protein